MSLLTSEVTSTPASFAEGVEFEETFPEPAPAIAPAPVAPAPAAAAALEQHERLERRLREAEALAKQTIERMRVQDEHFRLQKRTEDGLASRIEAMLVEWQVRFERQWRSELAQAIDERFAELRASQAAALRDHRDNERSPVRDAIAAATSARDLGRVLRDLLAEHAQTTTLSLAVHDAGRDEVAYRYRVASDDDLGAFLRRDTLDDGPQSAAAHMDGWVHGQRPVRVGTRNAVVHTAQYAVRSNGATLGVFTLQTEANAISDEVLARIGEIVQQAAPRLAALRAAGSLKGL
jgi:hypothetical protein